MLKELCKSNPRFSDIDRFEADRNGDSVNRDFGVGELLNSETLGMKRKRGRPRKHENVVFIRPPNKRLRTYTLKKEIVYDSERDRGNVNDRGVVVNVGELAELEDPYGPEIRRRTMGMMSEDELLEFLRGLNGQWGSRRRKRRVVEASEFGDVLPKGWKLSLCIKKKEGRVWLFVRRYLSPSGRQFESCKEISTYLISVIGETNMDKQNHVNINSSEEFSLKRASVNAADLVLQEDTKTDGPVDNLSPSSSVSPSLSPSPSPSPSPFSSPSQLSPPVLHVPTNCEGQVTLDAMKVQVESDAKNKYIGCNVKDEMQKTGPSVAPATEIGCDPLPMTGITNKESVTSVSTGDNVVVETVDAHSGDKLQPASPCVSYRLNSGKESDTDELVHDLNIDSHSKQDAQINVVGNYIIEGFCDMNAEVSRTDQALEATVSQSELLGDESNKKTGTSDKFHVNCVDHKSDCNLGQSVNLGNELLSPFQNEETGNASDVGKGKDSRSVSSTDQVLNQDDASETGITYADPIHDKSECMTGRDSRVGKDIVGTATSDGVHAAVSETGLLTKASICGEKGFGPNMDMDIDDTSDELISEKEKAAGESSSRFFLDRFGIDKDDVAVVKKLPPKSTSDSVKVANSENLISVGSLAHGTYNNNVNKFSSGSEISRLEQFDVGTNAFGSYGASGMEGVTTFQEENELNKNLRSDVPFSTMEEPIMQITSASSLLLSGGEQPSNKSEEPKLDDFNIFRNNEAKHNESEDVLGFNTKSNLEFCSLVPSENEQGFEFQDDVSCLYENTMEECKEESSERGLLNHFSDDIFENKIYSTTLDGLKFDEDRDLNSNELSLAFGNHHVPSKMAEAFDVHTNLSMVNNSMVEDLKVERGSAGGLFNLSGNVKTSSFHNAWEGIKSEEFKNSGNKFTTGYGGNHGQTHEEVVPSGMWRTGDGSQMRSGLSNPSHAQIPSPSSFHSFNIMSEKARDGQFRQYNDGFGASGLRSGRPEPVEFSFLTGRSQHNSIPLQGDSRVFSYNPQMGQQFNSPFWANPGGRNQMTAVCAWCRNQFHLQPGHSGTQDGIGSLCPSCTAMSGHVNML